VTHSRFVARLTLAVLALAIALYGGYLMSRQRSNPSRELMTAAAGWSLLAVMLVVVVLVFRDL
jgi:hypothetical protein